VKYIILCLTIFVLSFEPAYSSEDKLHPKSIEWQSDGAFGTFDRQSIQRGFKIYKEVCSACHSIKRIAFRNLTEIGFSEEEIKSLASEYSIVDGPDDEGEMFERPGRVSDYFPSPYSNDKAARAANNNSALPPDLSLITKAREGGANYVYSILTGYSDPPSNFELGENMHYNPYFAGGGKQFSMIPPLLKDGQIEYTDGIEATIDQMAKDISNFLHWAAEPEMEARKRMGAAVIIFLAIFTGIFYLAYKRIWGRVK